VSIALATGSACVQTPGHGPGASHVNLVFESLDATNSEDDASQLVVKTRVRNEWTAPIVRMSVYVQGLDEKGTVVASGMSVLPPGETLRIGDDWTFLVQMPNDPRIKRFQGEARGSP
jgi:hypothetical protein